MSADLLKREGYLETEDLDSIQYNYIKNNKNTEKTDSKVDTVGDIDLKKASGMQLAAKNIVKKYSNLVRKKLYCRPPPIATVDVNNEEVSDTEDTINCLDAIAEVQPGKNAQIAAKK